MQKKQPKNHIMTTLTKLLGVILTMWPQLTSFSCSDFGSFHLVDVCLHQCWNELHLCDKTAVSSLFSVSGLRYVEFPLVRQLLVTMTIHFIQQLHQTNVMNPAGMSHPGVQKNIWRCKLVFSSCWWITVRWSRGFRDSELLLWKKKKSDLCRLRSVKNRKGASLLVFTVQSSCVTAHFLQMLTHELLKNKTNKQIAPTYSFSFILMAAQMQNNAGSSESCMWSRVVKFKPHKQVGVPLRSFLFSRGCFLWTLLDVTCDSTYNLTFYCTF